MNRRIGFDTFVDKATRTTGTNSTELKDFYSTFIVNGWKTVGTETTCVFNNIPVEFFATDTRGEVVYKEEGQKPSDEWNFAANSWYYQNVRYWDKMATSYQFCAYTPVLADVAVDCAVDGTITIGTATAPVTVDGTNLMETPAEALAYSGFVADYMTATSTDANGTVALTFQHLQAKMNVRIKLHEDITTAQEVKVTDIQIHNLKDKAYYVSNATGEGVVSGWTLYTLPVDDEEDEEDEEEVEVLPVDEEEDDDTPASEETPYILSVTGPYALNGTTDNCHNHYVLEQLLIPQTISKPANSDPQLNLYNEACIYVEYTIGAETFRSYSPLADIFIGTGEATTYSFEGGKQYTINVIVGPSPIEFTATVDSHISGSTLLQAHRQAHSPAYSTAICL